MKTITMGAAELARSIKKGVVSPLDAVEAHIKRAGQIVPGA